VAIGTLEELRKRADELPPDQQIQLANYLLAKVNLQSPVSLLNTEEAILSQSALAKDWLRPEEDRAWANL
jgi:hypothetical protein